MPAALALALALLAGACTPAAAAPPTPLVVPLPERIAPMPVPADEPLTVEAVALGRWLFYDAKLAADGARSCATCHQQRYAFTDGQAASNVTGDVRRNTMPLFNLAWRQRYFWDGRVTSLREAAGEAWRDELEPDRERAVARLAADPRYPPRFAAAFGDPAPTVDRVERALAAFLRTIVSFDSRVDRVQRREATLTPLEMRGMELMTHRLPEGSERGRADFCDVCHTAGNGIDPRVRKGTALLSTDAPRHNGLPPAADGTVDDGYARLTRQEGDKGRFVVPTVRNLAYTAPYMHDGRFATLEEVVRHYSDHLADHPNLDPELKLDGKPARLDLSEEDVRAVAAILRAFSDEALVTNPAWSDPFAAEGR